MNNINQVAMNLYLKKAAQYNKLLNIKGSHFNGEGLIKSPEFKQKKIGIARKLKEARRKEKLIKDIETKSKKLNKI